MVRPLDDVTSPRVGAVVLAGGSGVRAGGSTNKVLLELSGVPVLVHSVRTALSLPGLRRLVVVVRESDHDDVAAVLSTCTASIDLWLVTGGATRHDSESAALDALRPEIDAGEIDVVVVHDAARPLASGGLWRAVVARAAEAGGAVPVLATAGLVSRTTRHPVVGQVTVQTPQAFRARALLDAYDAAREHAFAGPDTSACLEAYAPEVEVVAVAGERGNLKITWPGDVETAEALTAAYQPPRAP